MTLLVSFCEMCWSFISVFVVSEFGQRISNGFIEIDDEVCRFDWYRFPMEIQKLLPTIFIATQKPVSIQAFGSISMDRDNFKKVSPSHNQ